MSPVTFPGRNSPRRPAAHLLLPEGSLFLGGSPSAPHHRLYALVEGALSLRSYQRAFGPDGLPIQIEWPAGVEQVEVVSLCGFSAERFEEEMGSFEDLSTVRHSSTQRQKRREDLLSHFGGDRTPCLHIVLPFRSRHDPSARTLVQPGQWLMLELGADSSDAPGPAVHLDQPLTENDQATNLRLISMGLPVPEVHARLLDVFSLAHVHDARFEEREDDSGIAQTPPPEGPEPLSAQALEPLDDPDDAESETKRYIAGRQQNATGSAS